MDSSAPYPAGCRLRRALDWKPVSERSAARGCVALPRALAGLVAGSVLLLSASARAAESDIQLWPVVTIHHGLGERWGAHLQTRVRLDDDVSQVKDVLVRPFVSWRPLDSLTLDLGYDYLDSFQTRSEHRIWQSAEHRLLRRDLVVRNRVRLDQRFVEDVDGVVLRFRYRLRGRHPIGGSGWYGAVSDEVFANVNDRGEGPVSGFEQNRLRFAVGGILGRLRAESGYEWQYVESRTGPARNVHVFFVEFSVDTGDLPGPPWSPR